MISAPQFSASKAASASLHRPLPALEDVDRHRLRVVPPQFDRHGSEERERFDHAVQDRLGPFRGQGDGQRCVRVTPGDDQDRNLPPTIGEVDVDVPEVGLGTRPRPMLQRNERFAAVESLLLKVAADLVVLAGVPLLGDQAAMDLGGGMTLLPRSGLIRDENLVHERAKRSEHQSRPRGRRTGRHRLRILQCLENCLGRVVQLVGDRPEGQTVATELTNTSIVVHREHPCPPAAASSPHAGLCYGASHSEADCASLPDADYH